MARTYAIILAGGSGTRFWPLSRAARPKQLLPLAGGDESLLRATVRRLDATVDEVLVVTREQLREPTRRDLAGTRAQVLAEPEGRNTAPCIGWAAARVARDDPGAVCAVLPADHHIGDEASYAETLRAALAAAEDGGIVTVGVRPSRPETGYGYIEVGEPIAEGVCHARRFVEKPNRERAAQLLAAGTFLWNSGMFFFRAAHMLDAIDAHLPGLGAALRRIGAAPAAQEPALLAELYPQMPAVSIDHGVMEKVSDVRVIAADFGWSDLGGFTSAWELADKDAAGNAAPDDAVLIDSARCYVRASAGKLVALVGVDDLVVVETDDALVVVPRERAQDVRAVVAALAERDDPRR